MVSSYRSVSSPSWRSSGNSDCDIGKSIGATFNGVGHDSCTTVWVQTFYRAFWGDSHGRNTSERSDADAHSGRARGTPVDSGTSAFEHARGTTPHGREELSREAAAERIRGAWTAGDGSPPQLRAYPKRGLTP